MSDENIVQPPAPMPTAPVQDDSAMDEFEVKKPQIAKTATTAHKPTKTKIFILLGIVLVAILGSIAVVSQALKNTGTQVAQATPTPLPTVTQATPGPTPAKDLPAEWLNVENNINNHKDALTKPNDERGKMSVPSINFDTNLQE